MRVDSILITGGAGFVGSNLAFWLKSSFPGVGIICLDNLSRRGSKYNVKKLKEKGIIFYKADIRDKKIFDKIPAVNLIIDCAAEPSVLSGYKDSCRFIIDNNFLGTINCLEFARKNKANFIFLSTSRVYPFDRINNLNFKETNSRFLLAKNKVMGLSKEGISEDFSLRGMRSFYGASKFSSELFIQEYIYAYNLKTVINRCGVIAGPGQFGHSEQGIIAYWLISFLLKRPLKYIGWGGKGKQVRDVLHIDDFCSLIEKQIRNFSKVANKTYNVGGGANNSVSLQELSILCRKISKNNVKITSLSHNRPADVIWYISDYRRIKKDLGWFPKKNLEDILKDTLCWIIDNRYIIEHL